MISTRRAEEYGYVNRLIADYQLDGEVDRIASQVARSDRDAIRRTRSYFEQATLPEA
jgi:enoyl-CoA hydratase/carnithine racemase